MCKAREQRGLVIAATCKLTQKGDVWIVPSQSANTQYTVCPTKANPRCSCPDYVTRGERCKHIYAVEFVIQRELFSDGTVMETRSVTIAEPVRKVTYKQDWRSYNAAQNSEKATFQVLLRDLCKGIEEEPQVGRGRPRVLLQDAVFASVFKVYSTFSGRRFISDLNDAHAKGYLTRPLSHSSIFKAFESEGMFPILRALVERSAAPLTGIDVDFACDSSGFSGSKFDRWFDHKHGERKIRRSWVKCHLMCGVKSNIVTAVEIHDQHAGDSPLLKPLLATTVKRFKPHDVSADMGYLSNSNVHAIARAGAFPLIPFKSNSMPGQSRLWEHLYHFFHLHRDEFLRRYHLRSNVEATFSMIKRKFGDSCRSKTEVAMKNEVLAKLVCHNLCVVIQEMYESGVDPNLWTESPVVHKSDVG